MKAGNASYTSINGIPEIVPVFPLTGALLLPGGQMPLNIFEPRYLEMVEDAMRGEKLIGMIQPCLKYSGEPCSNPPLSGVGCLGRITGFQETGDGRYLISLSGICRYRVCEESSVNTGYRQCKIKIFEQDLTPKSEGNTVDRDALLVAFRNYLEANDMDADWESVETTDNETLVTALCMMSPYGPAEKQALLEAADLRHRAETLIAISEMHLARNCNDTPDRLQ